MTRATLREAAAPAVRSRSSQLRMTAGLARIEALFMLRSVLVLAGLLAGLLMIGGWYWQGDVQPLWWEADWRIGGGQLLLAMAVLPAAQLAAGRARRAAMTDLYASFPGSAGTRTLAQLAGLAGVLPASVLLAGVSVLIVDQHGSIGSPSVTVLAGGVVLVIAAGAAGIAIGTRFAHPLAGLLGALALFLPEAVIHVLPAWIMWLIPWEVIEDQMGSLPAPLAGYPPAGAHVAELAGIAVLAAIVALIITSRGARARAGLAAAAALAVAAICVAGAVQLGPVPTASLNSLAAEMASPGSVQRCTTDSQVRYCLYAGFGSELSSFEVPVSGVLALLPAQPGGLLTVRQVLSVDFTDPSLTRGQSQQQISRWNAQTRYAPGRDYPTTTAIYVPVGSWPAAGGALADAEFSVAMTAAQWSVGFPPTDQDNPCVAVDQARDAIAVWLAFLATHSPAGVLQSGLKANGSYYSSFVHNAFVPMWPYPGGFSAISGFGPQPTAAGYLLAKAMTALPEQQVRRVLEGSWATWLNWRTTDAQLAAALGIQMPSVPVIPSPVKPQPGAHMTVTGPPPQQSPVCTS
jgi:hypothetical protein